MQGFNMGRYVPPDLEGLVTGNTLNRKHPLGSRASKLASHGLLTVRFEMPFPIWCASCSQPTLIPQGVRFNASKSKTGSFYHTTPIYSFTIRHTACGGTIVIQTDPKNTDYVILSGARRQNVSTSTEDLVSVSIKTQREQQEARETAFGKLEKTIADREQARNASVRISELQDTSERQWEDPFAANRRLRAGFRAGRHKREKDAAVAEDIKGRMGLGIELLAEQEEDGLRAQLVDFGAIPEVLERGAEKALVKPLFESNITERRGNLPQKEGKGRLKSEMKAERIRVSLAEEIRTNTRAAKDPFLVAFGGNSNSSSSSSKDKEKGSALLPGLKKRKRLEEDEGGKPATLPSPSQIVEDVAVIVRKEEDGQQQEGSKPAAPAGQRALLVSYNSDSD
ncbi:CWC16 protein [Triangularia setosa]|uniref:CWC16 protein n=1 Tax=Triangularia setosa TaxID=2587417 RepID=A0AAN6WCE4_9PEZI|nr:CWC16 protein [Podospora setosa]